MNKQGFKTQTLIKYFRNAEKIPEMFHTIKKKKKRQRSLKTYSFFLRSILCLDCYFQHIYSCTQFLHFWPYLSVPLGVAGRQKNKQIHVYSILS